RRDSRGRFVPRDYVANDNDRVATNSNANSPASLSTPRERAQSLPALLPTDEVRLAPLDDGEYETALGSINDQGDNGLEDGNDAGMPGIGDGPEHSDRSGITTSRDSERSEDLRGGIDDRELRFLEKFTEG
ncbi:hypothetical protein FOZ63_023371, partial [Perkinsus olseni]